MSSEMNNSAIIARQMFHRYLLLALLLGLVNLCVISSSGSAHSFEAFRLTSYERGGVIVGGRKSSLTSQLVALAEITDPLPPLARKAVAVTLTAHSSYDDIARVISQSHAAAVILLLPELTRADADSERADAIVGALSGKTYETDVLFAFPSAELTAAMTVVNEATDDQRVHVTFTQALLPAAAPAAGAAVTATTYAHTAFLQSSDNGPTIAIAVPIGSLTAISSHSYSLSSTAALIPALTLLRHAHSRYAISTTRPPYNLLFIFHPQSAPFNFAGLKQYIRSIDTRLLDSLDMTIALDAVAAMQDDKIFVHTAMKRDKEGVRLWLKQLEHLSAPLHLRVEHVYHKLNKSAPTRSSVLWPHELFSRKRISSMTLSGRNESAVGLNSDRLYDTTIDLPNVQRYTRLLIETFLHIAYGVDDTRSLYSESDAAADVAFMNGVYHLLQSTNRGPHCLSNLTCPFNAALISILNSYANSHQSSALTSDYVFTPESATPLTAQITFQRSFRVEFALTIAVALYAATVFIIAIKPKSIADVTRAVGL